MRVIRVALALLLVVAVPLARDGPQAVPARELPPDVLLIVLDTLRADRLGFYGSPRKVSHHLDQLADQATVFHRAYAASSWTKPSVASLLASRLPSQHGVTRYGNIMPTAERTLPQVLHAHGYDTHGRSANPLVSARAFGAGFDTLVVLPTRPRPTGVLFADAAQLTNDALLLTAVQQRQGPRAAPTFLYLHYMEPHPPYDPPPRALLRLAPNNPPQVQAVNAAVRFGPLAKLDSKMVRDLEIVYDASVMALDERLGALFRILAERRYLDHAIVIITADHGEGFMEHDLYSHGNSLYEELIHVPLLIRLPGQHERRDVHEVVSLLDLAPTVLDLVGLPAPPRWEGRSLRPLLEPAGWRAWLATTLRGPAAVPPSFGELLPHDNQPLTLRAALQGYRKAVAVEGGSTTAFDLQHDPGEQAPEAPSPADEAALAELGARAGAAPSPAFHEPLDAAKQAELRALGYLQ